MLIVDTQQVAEAVINTIVPPLVARHHDDDQPRVIIDHTNTIAPLVPRHRDDDQPRVIIDHNINLTIKNVDVSNPGVFFLVQLLLVAVICYVSGRVHGYWIYKGKRD